MQRNEEIGVVAAGDGDALAQGNVNIGVAGEVDGVAALFQRFGNAPGFVEHHVFLLQAIYAGGPRIDAAMAGIDDDHLPGERRLGSSRGRDGFGGRFAGAQIGGPPGRLVELRLRGGEEV